MIKETICALATAQGGALNVIRVSGEKAIIAAENIFNSAAKTPLSKAKSHTIHFGTIVNEKKETVDEVLVSVFMAPNSYTGENSVEISCHASKYVTEEIIRQLINQGCRNAEPGEFTKRAFLNGKIDLSQAEAVADVIASTNKTEHKTAINQLKGGVKNEISKLRKQLLHLTTLMELELDFSEHDVEFADRSELKTLAEKIKQRIIQLKNTFKDGNAIKNGVPIAIIGKTNVGKSTLLNTLAQEEKAIVSNIHGTTRDSIEAHIVIKGVEFRFTDTAGLRNTSNKIEQIGIRKTKTKAKEAKLVLWIFDKQPTKKEIAEIAEITKNKKLIAIQNKTDKNSNEISLQNISPQHILKISAKYGDGIEDLKNKIIQTAGINTENNEVIITNLRHFEALRNAEKSINSVLFGLNNNVTEDLVSEDLRETINNLGDITGENITSNEVFENIFKHFCIGK